MFYEKRKNKKNAGKLRLKFDRSIHIRLDISQWPLAIDEQGSWTFLYVLIAMLQNEKSLR